MPEGGLDWPDPLLPQQWRLPFDRRAQEWRRPALTDVKVPEGSSDWPQVSRPKQSTDPDVVNAQV